MIRALTIRFGIMGVGVAILTVVLNLTKPDPNRIMLAVVIYLTGGALAVLRYVVAHQDEIPVRPRDPRR